MMPKLYCVIGDTACADYLMKNASYSDCHRSSKHKSICSALPFA